MPRTDAETVKSVLLDDYGPRRDGTLPALTIFIATATKIVNRVETLAATRGFTLDTEELTNIETWLAAHLYQQSDRGFQSKSQGGASASFNGQTAMGLDSTMYGQTAKMLDPSGSLESLMGGKQEIAVGEWLGSTQAELEDEATEETTDA